MPRRDPKTLGFPLKPAAGVFASGVLVAALIACRASTDTTATAEPTEAPVASEAPEREETPLHVKAPEAPPAAKGVLPVPTSVVIHPGHEPMRTAGMMPVHHADRI